MDYSQSDINHMRQDALRRTREMHSRSGYSKNNVQARKAHRFPRNSLKLMKMNGKKMHQLYIKITAIR